MFHYKFCKRFEDIRAPRFHRAPNSGEHTLASESPNKVMTEEGAKDPRVEFLRGKVATAFKYVKADRLEKGFYSPESMYARLLL